MIIQIRNSVSFDSLSNAAVMPPMSFLQKQFHNLDDAMHVVSDYVAGAKQSKQDKKDAESAISTVAVMTVSWLLLQNPDLASQLTSSLPALLTDFLRYLTGVIQQHPQPVHVVTSIIGVRSADTETEDTLQDITKLFMQFLKKHEL